MPGSIGSTGFYIGDHSISYNQVGAQNISISYNALTLKSGSSGNGNNPRLYSGGTTRAGAKYTAAATSEFGTMTMKLVRLGAPQAVAVNFTIRRTSDSVAVFTEQLFADANSISTSPTNYSVEFTPGTLPAGEYYFMCEFTGTGDASNYIALYSMTGLPDATIPVWIYTGAYSAFISGTYSTAFSLSYGQKWTFA
jgi:hypothetical protein